MHFKRLFGLFLFLTIAWISFVQADTHPLGLIIRRSLPERLLKHLDLEHQALNFRIPITDPLPLTVEVSLKTKWSSPEWSHVDSGVFLKLPLSGLNAEIQIFSSDDSSKLIETVHVEIASLVLQALLDPTSLEIHLDPGNISEIAKSIKITEVVKNLGSADHSSEINIDQAFLIPLLRALYHEIDTQILNWIHTQLRGLVLVQPVRELFDEESVWNQKTLVQKGPVTLEFEGIAPAKQELTFAFFPFSHNPISLSPNQIEVWMDSGVFNREGLHKILGIPDSKLAYNSLVDQTQKHLSDPSHWASANFVKPALADYDHDLSIDISKDLLDDVLGTVYQEGLLRFKTEINLGSQARSKINPAAPDVSMMVRIGPKATPKLTLDSNSNQIQLHVQDFSTEIYTHIEDRDIPSTEILTQASILSGLNVDSQSNLNLQLDPNHFELNLQDVRGRLKDQDIDVIHQIAKGYWQDFLETHSNLVLFPTVLRGKNPRIRISAVSFGENSVLLHFDLMELKPL